MQAVSHDGKYLIITFVPTVMGVAPEELRNVSSRVQLIKSSCMVPPETAPDLYEVIRANVFVVTGSSTLGAPLAMYISMTDGLPASHNEKYVHFRLQHTVEAHRLLRDKIACFATSDFGGAHAAFRLMVTCAVRKYRFLLRTLPP
jgi:hypothetical protein